MHNIALKVIYSSLIYRTAKPQLETGRKWSGWKGWGGKFWGDSGKQRTAELKWRHAADLQLLK